MSTTTVSNGADFGSGSVEVVVVGRGAVDDVEPLASFDDELHPPSAIHAAPAAPAARNDLRERSVIEGPPLTSVCEPCLSPLDSKRSFCTTGAHGRTKVAHPRETLRRWEP